MEEVIQLSSDGTFKSLRIDVVSSGPVSELYKLIMERALIEPFFVPYVDGSCAAIAQNNKRRMYLMYLAPKKRIIRYQGTDKTHEFTLAMPHVYIAIFFRGNAIEMGCMLMARKKIRSVTDPIGRLPMPNTYAPYGKLCEGGVAAWPITQDPHDTAVSYMEFAIGSDFLPHINSHFEILPKQLKHDGDKVDAVEYNMRLFQIWQELSKEGIEKILSLDWETPFTLRDVIQDIWRTNDRN